jgi:hypothetical protein
MPLAGGDDTAWFPFVGIQKALSNGRVSRQPAGKVLKTACATQKCCRSRQTESEPVAPARQQKAVRPSEASSLPPVTRESNDTHGLQPMAEAAKVPVGELQRMNVIANAGYFNGEQVEACVGKGILPRIPAIVRSTIRATTHSSTAPPSRTRKKATRLSVRLGQTLTRKGQDPSMQTRSFVNTAKGEAAHRRRIR